ncbi:hypothetical protein [Chryseobacterium gregarium]|uniref:hypothetical protein n=1 Tax=Chryseobacterium gregarium TaxID=456299 RepID=UPI000404E492|nr:hypothetical protein [Chryseobacterium gregarium]
MYKYKINESLELLPAGEHLWAVENIPVILNIPAVNFRRYRDLRIDDLGDIPYVEVRRLELFFRLEIGTLMNKKIHSKTLREILKSSKNTTDYSDN